MAASFAGKCPHCFSENAAFTFVAEARTSDMDPTCFSVFLQCNLCRRGIEVYLKCLNQPRPNNYTGDMRKGPFQIFDVSPKPVTLTIPQHLPDNIANYYRQAVEAAQRTHWDACGAMCRKALDVATKEKGANASSGMKARLNELQTLGKLTPDLNEWGQAIWKDGSDASHDSDPFTEHEAKQILFFTELFLMYVYTLPGMLSARRAVMP